MLVTQIIQVSISNQNESYCKVFNNFQDYNFLTQYFVINFMFGFPKVFSDERISNDNFPQFIYIILKVVEYAFLECMKFFMRLYF